ncbi:MAG: hypothetical protein DWI57_05855 [Chloroflexi bacterium]|nr:MAG: hypothetical protein DWI57_05855 [Chloroflexota bacterium]
MSINSAFAFGLDLARILAATAFLYILPGLGFTVWLSRSYPLRWSEHLALAPSISIALYTIIFLWAYTLGIAPGPVLVWILPLLGVALALWQNREWLSGFSNALGNIKKGVHRENMPDLILLFLIGLLFASRFSPIRLLTEPFWGDSVHHTFITQLIVDNGGLFQSWDPYSSIRSLTYHFGFHVVAAQWVWLTGAPAPEAVLIFGQICNGLAVLALYPLALRLSDGPSTLRQAQDTTSSGHRNRWAAIGTVVVAGFLLTMPAYYVNWGRYTQLIGQVILPVLIWLFVVVWDKSSRPNRAFWVVAVLLAAGLALTHYRVAFLAVTAGLGWGVWGIWKLRRQPGEIGYRLLWLAAAGVVSGGLILPWVVIIRGGAMQDLFARVAQRPASNPALVLDMALWLKDVPRFYPIFFWVGAILLLLLALWKKRSLALPLLLWACFTFFVANPFLLRLPGTGWVSNFLVIIAIYIPLALLWGWAGGSVAAWLWEQRFGPWLVGILLVGILSWGTLQQVRVVDFFHRMVWPSDRIAFQWIEENTPADSRFLINGFSIYTGVLVVGSDAGWWLPFFTQRAATIPPASYFTEHNAEGGTIADVDKVEEDVRASNGDPALLQSVLCRDEITHVYLGQRRGEVGFGATQLVPEEWLTRNPVFTLLFQEEKAQVWSFDRGVCAGG